MSDLESPEKIAKDIQKLERNLNQVAHIEFLGKEKEVYDRAVDYWNDSKYYLEKKDMRTAFGCIEYSHGLLDALRIIHYTIKKKKKKNLWKLIHINFIFKQGIFTCINQFAVQNFYCSVCKFGHIHIMSDNYQCYVLGFMQIN